jgi:hypothetical protein
MPKNRMRANRKGAKSIAIRTKEKIGGRKSGKGVKQLSPSQLNDIFETCRPRDRFKLIRETKNRLVLRAVAPSVEG